MNIGDLIKVIEDTIYDPHGISNQLGIIVKDGRQTAKVRWLNPKPHKPTESWVHYNRLRLLCKSETLSHSDKNCPTK